MSKGSKEKKAGGEDASSAETVAPKEFVADGAPVTEAPAAKEPDPKSATSLMIAAWRRNSKVLKAVMARYEGRKG